MSAHDSDLKYIYVPRNAIDAAIMELEKVLENESEPRLLVPFNAVLKVLKELYRRH